MEGTTRKRPTSAKGKLRPRNVRETDACPSHANPVPRHALRREYRPAPREYAVASRSSSGTRVRASWAFSRVSTRDFPPKVRVLPHVAN
jgi:hypothetical protein